MDVDPESNDEMELTLDLGDSSGSKHQSGSCRPPMAGSDSPMIVLSAALLHLAAAQRALAFLIAHYCTQRPS